MKNNILKIVLALFVTITYTSCEEDPVVFDNINGQSAYSFATQSYNVSVPPEDLTISVPVEVTTVSSEARNVAVTVDAEATTGVAGEYTIGSVTIPAGSHLGTLDVNLDFSGITGEDGETKDLVINIDAPEGEASYFDTVTITYFRAIICNDVVVEINSDVWATETGFSIKDAAGNFVVPETFPFGGNATVSQNFTQTYTLPDGDYVFRLIDTYGDGQVGTGGGVTLTGNYSVTCSIIVHAQGEGVLDNGSYEDTPFTVNP
ncbi:hypothetical protein [Psychroserpens sp. SPM9]|uniref:hypothetical protein n=1 Tax=Psychroserpens sp. SPM9 TaxID=2975598 RepID=UPI0021A8150A|nr:hypothetical protein [Psychroserpens sp. SPM9]MDG5492621.1 hypothetical protein [Psychroserpens sp. SPM9]